jgi:hypothetical protein
MATTVRVSAFAGGVLNSKEITHEQNLVDAEAEAQSFLHTMAELGDRLGPLLLQLPPSFEVEGMGVLEDFLERLPEGFRFAVEVRHRSWLGSDLPEMLGERGVALTLIDYPKMPRMEEATADFSYIRWLGDRREFPEGHTHLEKERDEDHCGGRISLAAFSKRAGPSSPTPTTTTRTTPPRRSTGFWRSGVESADGWPRHLQYRLALPFRP